MRHPKVDIPQPRDQTKDHKLKSAKISQLQATEGAGTEKRIYVSIAASTCHINHGFSNVGGFSRTMDKSLVEQTSLLVKEGIKFVSYVEKCLHYHVHEVLFPKG